MSVLRRILKVKGGYEVTVSCSNKPTLTAFYRTYEQCGKFADDYFLDYLGVELKSVHHPENDGVVPEDVNPDSLETMEIEIPMNKRLKELAEQAGVSFHHALGATYTYGKLSEILERFAELVRQDEREACAKLCEDLAREVGNKNFIAVDQRQFCAKQIRARGNDER